MNTEQFNEHTPGPWRTNEGEPYDDEVSHLDIVDANGMLVTETSYYTDIDHPNARLIAAAPELLAALIKARKELAAYYQWANDVSAFVNSNASDEMYHHLECLMVEAGVWTEDEDE